MKDSRSELKAQDAMKSLRCYEKLKVVVGMNDSRSWAQASKFYEQL